MLDIFRFLYICGIKKIEAMAKNGLYVKRWSSTAQFISVKITGGKYNGVEKEK